LLAVHFGKRKLMPAYTDHSGPASGRTTFLYALRVRLTGCLPKCVNLPMPPPSGTVQRLSLGLFQSAVMMGEEVRNQPSGRF